MNYRKMKMIIVLKGGKNREIIDFNKEIQEFHEEKGDSVFLVNSEEEFVLEYKYCKKDKIYKSR